MTKNSTAPSNYNHNSNKNLQTKGVTPFQVSLCHFINTFLFVFLNSHLLKCKKSNKKTAKYML